MNGFNKLRMTSDELRIAKIFCVLVFVFCGSMFSVKAQSINQSYPTAITTNEISGQIPARDVGDARLTSYFYVFNATQGDVFINVVTKNLNGDIDIFTADNLRPLSKITIYADASDGETGRIVYLRQPMRLILRIEGRTPSDNAATYRIKFAGSFAPAVAENTEPETPQVKSDNQTDVRVNSVGTIIEIKPKPVSQPKETVAETKPVQETKARVAEDQTPLSEVETAPEKSQSQTAVTEKGLPVENQKEAKTTVAVTDSPEEIKETNVSTASAAPSKKKPVAKKKVAGNKTTVEIESKESKRPKAVKPLPASVLENIRLVVLFKDGTKIERPMSDVLKVGVDRGILTVVTKDGQISRYSILDVEKMTIE